MANINFIKKYFKWTFSLCVWLISTTSHGCEQKLVTPIHGEQCIARRTQGMDYITYSREELVLIRTECQLTLVDNELIKSFNRSLLNNTLQRPLKRTTRGTRGGVRKQRKSGKDICQPTKSSKHSFSVNRKIQETSETKDIKALVWNARSACNKTTEINEFILEHDLDILFLTESWIKENDDVIKAELTPKGYSLVNKARSGRRKGGGIAVIFKSYLNFEVNTSVDVNLTSFECVETILSAGSDVLRMMCIYRPPPSKQNKLTPLTFLSEFETFLHLYGNKPGKLAIFGDFNFHFDDTEHIHIKKITWCLESLNFHQNVSVPTHKCGHILDWVITRKDENFMNIIKVEDLQMSDHFVIFCLLNVTISKRPVRKQSYRNLRKLDRDSFKKDIISSSLYSNENRDTDNNVNLYNTVLSTLLNKHAPQRDKVFADKPASPWYTDEIKEQKTIRRKLEQRWRKSKLEIHRQCYVTQKTAVNNLMRREKVKYYNQQIITSECDSKKLFKITSRLQNKNRNKVLPDLGSDAETCVAFGNYFRDKIDIIHKQLSDENIASSVRLPPEHDIEQFSHFNLFSETEVLSLIKEMKTKTCDLDPIPTTLLIDCIDPLLPHLTKIINTSLASGKVPDSLKFALVNPTLKKEGLKKNILKNYRPLSNLPFVSKLLEKAVATRLQEHLIKNNLYEKFQSAYKTGHSTETALIRVINDLLTIVDQGQGAALILLDLSAAFDTVDHEILLQTAEHDLGINGTVLTWLKSYLCDRHQSIVINGSRSPDYKLDRGVPQGSVLGPILFTLYTKSLSKISANHGMNHHQYADDNQLYIGFSTPEAADCGRKIENCCADIKNWMASHMLKLNQEKTEFLLIGSKQLLKECEDIQQLTIGDSVITAADKVKNLGVILDQQLSMKNHVTRVCQTANYNLRNIGKLRPYLTKSSTEKLILSEITSRIDYCNSLLVNAPKEHINKLQCIQNSAARIIFKSAKYDHITPYLKDLHWLPVEARIDYKILINAYKCYNHQAPTYLCDILPVYTPQRSLRSEHKHLFKVPRVKTSSFGKRTFAFAAASKWNNLPEILKSAPTLASFKNNLKTHLYRRHYDC